MPSNNDEIKYYTEKRILKDFRADSDPNGVIVPEGDPGLYFHEFVLLLSRIGIEILKDSFDMKSMDTNQIVELFLNKNLGFAMVQRFLQPGGPNIDEDLFDNIFVKRIVSFLADGLDNFDISQIRAPEPEPEFDEL